MDNKEIVKYFRINIFEAFALYTVWKMLSHSKSPGVVPKQMANKYQAVQKYHQGFFTTAERAHLVGWVMFILHPFDSKKQAQSFYKLDRKRTTEFAKANESVLDALFALRNQLFAHRDKNASSKSFIVPSVVNTDEFFVRLSAFFNELAQPIDGIFTDFKFAEDLKHDTENLLMNVYRGEAMRPKEIEVEYEWLQNPKKASDVL